MRKSPLPVTSFAESLSKSTLAFPRRCFSEWYRLLPSMKTATRSGTAHPRTTYDINRLDDRAPLDYRRLLVLPEGVAHDAADLAQGAVGVHGLQDVGHQILLAAAGVAQGRQRAAGAVVVALRS